MAWKKRVLVTIKIPDSTLSLLKEHFEVDANEEDILLPREELVARMKEADGVFSLLTDRIDSSVIEQLDRTRVIANCAVGFDNIDIDAATKKGIVVTNTPGVLTGTTADFAFSLLCAAARRVVEGDKYSRAGKFKRWGLLLMLGQDIHGKTLGLLGMGRIGQAMAKRARGFGMNVIYNDICRYDDFEKEHKVTYMEQEDVIQNADFLSIHVPLVEKTRHMISDRQFGMMKPTAVLINTSRGPVVDEDALVRALREKKIFAAGLDVYEHEPSITKELIGLDNVVLAPHIASASVETRTRMANLAAENLISFFSTGKAKTPVNPEVTGDRRSDR